MDWTHIKDIVTPIAAITGMFLGIWNLVQTQKRDKVKLKIIPRSASYFASGKNVRLSSNEFKIHPQPDRLVIEVINLSQFPITIDEVGLFAPKRKVQFFKAHNPIIHDGGPWPRRLERNESVHAYINWSDLLDKEDSHLITLAYAMTACDHTQKGDSKALQDLIRNIS